MRVPVLIINFKNYREGYGDRGLDICRYASRVSVEYGLDIYVAPPTLMLIRFIERCDADIYVQHADPVTYGAYTGSIPIEALKDIGVKGVIINHSEKQLEVRHIIELVDKARQYGLVSVACADTPVLGKIIALAGPTAIALEPPELIGSGIAVSRAKPEIIVEGVKSIKSISRDIVVLAGAGISSRDDVEKALRLGSEGVLVASAIMKARDPGKVIEEFAQAMVNYNNYR